MQKTTTSARKNSLERWLVVSLVVVGLLLIVIFGLRAVKSYRRIRHTQLPIHTTDVEAIRNWMTISYLSKVYQVPEDYLFTRIGVPPDHNQRISLRRLGQRYRPGQPDALVKAVKEAISEYQSAHPPRAQPNHE